MTKKEKELINLRDNNPYVKIWRKLGSTGYIDTWKYVNDNWKVGARPLSYHTVASALDYYLRKLLLYVRSKVSGGWTGKSPKYFRDIFGVNDVEAYYLSVNL